MAHLGVWDLVTDQIREIYSSPGTCRHVDLSADGKMIIAGVGNELVVLNTGDFEVMSCRTFQAAVSLAAHPQKNLLAFADNTRQLGRFAPIQIWDLDERRVVQELARESCNIASMKFSRDGKQLAAGSKLGTVLHWTDWNNERTHTELQGHWGFVWDLDFSPDGRRIATAGLDRSVRLWNCQTGNVLHVFRTVAEWNYAVAFNHHGTELAYAGGKGTKFGSIHFVGPDHSPINRK